MIKPNTNLILAQLLEPKESKTTSGLILNDTINTKQMNVISIGKDVKFVKVNDNIIVSASLPLVIEGVTYFIVKEEQILVIIK